MSQFRQWRASLKPTRVDIVGDFAGRGLFAIHGEAMLTYYLEHARVDFDYSFQLLHLVHAIETFLAKLRDRGCSVNILWFEEEADVCMPTEIRSDNLRASKYRLARAVLIQHFSCPTILQEAVSKFSRVFPNLQSCDFREYLDNNPLHFFLGSNAHDECREVDGHNTALEMLYRIASAGYCVAFIEGVEFKSSKVYLSMTTPRGSSTPLVGREEQFALPVAPSSHMVETMNRLAELKSAEGLTAREFVSISALAVVLSSGVEGASKQKMLRSREVAAVLLHLVVLRHCGLQQRSFAKPEFGKMATTNTAFLAEFFDTTRDGLTAWFEGDHSNLEWDTFDLFDGCLYLNVFTALSNTRLPQQFSEELARMAQLLSTLSGAHIDIDALLDLSADTADTASNIDPPCQDRPPETTPPVLPFNHPIMDQHLSDVRLQTDSILTESSISGKIFQELAHWHNARAPVDPKHVPKPRGFFAKKRHQKFMSDTMAYSASLTGASGKNIDPETIVVQDPTAKLRIPATGRPIIKEKEKVPRTKNGVNKSNKQKALEHGEARRQEKQAALSQSVAASWRERCREFEKQPSLVKRYLRTEAYALALSNSHWQIVGSEALLYLVDVLLQMPSSPQTPNSSDFALLAMIWSKSTDAAKLPLTHEVSSRLRLVGENLQIAFQHHAGMFPAPSRPLAFKPIALKGMSLLPSRVTSREFLLEHCGPYLERSFESAPDSRVPSFHPDAWQRKVLDTIDADKSLLVVAPTSAGKTFISFYAMKKVLQANDSDILVYVAPTKALVNQIAAEIQARFSKHYGNREGRSVWAIHTRDYRVNSPKGCQILVTVPSMLQILLLAPVNAKRPTDFSRRIKRIIFDEVHCIGQSDEGVIWEQLLLLAPCPIIALSATIANPDEFKSWLERSQTAKGFELEMIVHSSRYSDLRKFLHDPVPLVSEFTGLAPVERLPFPGLDSELRGSGSTPFLFVHPIASMVDRNRETLNDTSMEPRDCLTLWRCMKRHQSSEYTISAALDPENALPELVRKSDVVRWETALKDRLAEWMVDPKSPFDALQEELRGQRYSQLAQDYTDTPCSSSGAPSVDAPGKWPLVSSRSVFSLLTDLRASGALPAILFNYDRTKCEAIVARLFQILTLAERKYRATNQGWIAKIAEFEAWKKAREAVKVKQTKKKASARATGRRGEDDGNEQGKAHSQREAASRDVSKWESFNSDAPLAQFSFADTTKMTSEELEERLQTIQADSVRQPFIDALRRGMGVHHAGMNRQYRQVVEMLFRKGYLTVVVATGTLAMGINMPCKTVIFTGDSIFLTALNYRQASGRAGRRGFDVLGNVVFHNMPPHRALEIMSAKLPDLRGQFPTSVTLILRLFILLHGTNNSSFAADAVNSLLTQNRLYLGGPDAKMSIAHHLRFSIDYLRRHHLLSATGEPLNFAGLVGHLYYVESAAFAFHALLQEGYFHELCASFSPSMNPTKRRDMTLELVLTLSHLFGRIPRNMTRPNTSTTRRTSLPRLPRRPYNILARHNAQTLAIFRAYVHSYATQHLASTPDNTLPFTHHTIPASTTPTAALITQKHLPYLSPVTIRSPFTALSGFTDADFATTAELCETVRAGVPLEASVVPGVPLDRDDGIGAGGYNSYLYDFFKHGDAAALTRENGIGAAEVWVRLKDFSLVLATVVAGLEGFLAVGEREEGMGEEEEQMSTLHRETHTRRQAMDACLPG